jgi:hypothetical protein
MTSSPSDVLALWYPTAGPRHLVSFVPPFEFWGTEVIHATSHDILINPYKLGVNKRHCRNSERLQVLSQLESNALTVVWFGGQTPNRVTFK